VRHRPLAIALAVVLAAAALPLVAAGSPTASPAFVAGDGPAADRPAADPQNATFVAAYPNPVERDDAGEFVVVRFPRATNTTGWTLTDGTTAARLPDRTLSGTVALTATPNATASKTDHPVVGIEGRFGLANGGERLELRAGDRTVDTARYRNAPEAAVRDFRREAWRPLGATDFEPVRTGGGPATAFVLPDAPDRTVETLASADERLLLAGYTLTSGRITDALLAAHDRGVTVRVTLDGSPAGGMTDRQARQLDRLTDAGVEVRVLAGPYTRYAHHHPKYAVVDDRALVLTENFKPAGTGGMSSRGWGVTLSDPSAAETLADLHEADRTARAATPWREYRSGREFADADPALGEFPTRHEPAEVAVTSTTVLVAPDNAADAVTARLDAAEDRVLIQQVTVDSRDNRLLRATLRAADRGVRVRILLSDAWYVEEDNAALAGWLNRRADAEDWDLKARVDEPRGYEKIHAKGVIVDDAALVGSLNWGATAQTENREVVVALEGGAADYYADVFAGDWSGPSRRSVPTALVGVAAVAVAAAALLARRIEIAGRDGVVGWES
jgi:phosphatidylserine/phosphatidylglycerophosphate/cardiolipin synthase-like enzyme